MATIKKRETKGGVRWTAQVYVGKNPATGKAQFVSKTFERDKDAKAWAREQETLKDRGSRPTTTTRTLAEYLKVWLLEKEDDIAARTAYDYKTTIERWVAPAAGKVLPRGCPAIGSHQIRSLAKEDFVQLYAFMRSAGSSRGAIKKTHVVLRIALNDAVVDELIYKNPTDNIKGLSTRRRNQEAPDAESKVSRIRSMDSAQADAFIHAAKSDRFSALWHVLLTTGLRPGEALGLRWSDIDFESRTVSVANSLTRVPGRKGWTLDQPKTPKSNRKLRLAPLALEELRAWRTEQKRERFQAGPEWQDNGFVFT